MTHKQPDSELERRIAERYEGEGYKVDVQPQPESLPFDLGPYEPDMVVKLPNGEHLVIEVKAAHTNLDVDRLRAVAETVTRHPGDASYLSPMQSGCRCRRLAVGRSR